MIRRPNRNNVKREPTHKEIRAACARIRAGWSDAERLRRSGAEKSGCWTPPMVDREVMQDALQDTRSK